ncbi:MAG: hypothetical protein Hyperionvirus29_4 [Hyperionvirus sp.]|uniref:Uncharacterized protein n=1 Tax=Hyperionvirus sp. TaxID=2487770 RepID=A0A3G5AE52_9VIRU|nr:MAG: hypothetical protein Hyperionvirus29_4 [Hyperionvirus sp.]
MNENKIKDAVPDLTNDGWAWGNNMTAEDALSVLKFHLSRFLKLANDHPNAYFLSDSNEKNIVILKSGHQVSIGKIKTPFDIDDDSDNDSEISYPVTVFLHPLKGKMMVKTFSDCMEVFGLLRAVGDKRAKLWYDLAFRMKPDDA